MQFQDVSANVSGAVVGAGRADCRGLHQQLLPGEHWLNPYELRPQNLQSS